MINDFTLDTDANPENMNKLIEGINKNEADIEELKTSVEGVGSQIGQKLVVSASNIPIAERKEGSFYFIITDQQAVGSLENIKVSPTMGLKLI